MKKLFPPTTRARSTLIPQFNLGDGQIGKPKFSGVYLIHLVPEDKIYIGSSVNIWRRWKSHFCSLIAGKHYNGRLQELWSQHGSAAFEPMVLEMVPEANLVGREQYWMDCLLDSSNALNIALQATHCGPMTEARRERLRRRSWTRKYLTEEMILEIQNRLHAGERPKGLAVEIGIGAKTLSRINRNTYLLPNGTSGEPFDLGEKHFKAKLKNEDVVAIRSAISKGSTYVELAKKYGVGCTNIGAIASGEIWTHVLGGPTLKPRKKNSKRDLTKKGLSRLHYSVETVEQMVAWRKGGMSIKEVALKSKISYSRTADILAVYEARTSAGLDPWETKINPGAKLTPVQVIEIRRRFDAGERSQTALAAEYGVTMQILCGIVNNQAWKHLPLCQRPGRSWGPGNWNRRRERI